MHWELQSVLLGAAIGPVAIWIIKRFVDEVKASGTSNSKTRGLRVVITGSSRGLGLALADQFLQLGDKVAISSRNKTTVDAALQTLRQHHPSGTICGSTCDVSKLDQVEALAMRAVEVLGGIDIWINNAALSNNSKLDVTQMDPHKAQDVVATNVLGSLWGSRVAIAQMKMQETGGKVFLIDGTGAWGNATPKNVAYGATKRGLTQLKDSLAAQVKGSRISIHMASPGMVATPLLFEAVDSARSAKFVNILAESTQAVAAWLVPRMRGASKNGSYIKYLTPRGVLWRLLTFGTRKDRFIDGSKFKSA